jgi:hypothetical protein
MSAHFKGGQGRKQLISFIHKLLNIWTMCLYKKDKHVRLEVLKAATTKVAYFCVVMLYVLVDAYQCIRGRYYLQKSTYQEIVAALLRVLPDVQMLFHLEKEAV